MLGQVGDDQLGGGAGGDKIYGGAGADRLDDGPGNDELMASAQSLVSGATTTTRSTSTTKEAG